MAKSRMLSRSIALDKELNNLSLKSQLIYTWCIPFLDDYGLITNDADKIKYMVFPRNQEITVDNIQSFMDEAVDKGVNSLIDRLHDCLHFNGFEKNNVITDYKKARSEFQENGFNKGKSKSSPGVPSNPQESPSKDKLSQDNSDIYINNNSGELSTDGERPLQKIIFPFNGEFILHDGGRAIQRRGRWVDARDPSVEIDTNYYPELTK